MNENNINWYPGHMARTKRELKENIKLIDCIYELVDARMPISSKIKNIEKIIYEEEQPIEEFDDIKFDNLVEKIIIGEKDINGNINPNIVRFILKIGTDYKFDNLSFVTNKK